MIPILRGQYTVHVCTLTYNQSQYIEDTLRGVAMQQTTFEFVHQVIDDCSTDGEQDVINAYLEREADMAHAEHYDSELAQIIVAKHRKNTNCTFAVYLLKKNLYNDPRKLTLFASFQEVCKYEALCEGDDYWTDPQKLQKQVNLLEEDETLMAVVTNSSLVDAQGKEIQPTFTDNVVKDNVEGRYNLRDFFHVTHHYPTATVLYRNSHLEEMKEMRKKLANPFFGDWTLWIRLHIFGDFYYINKSMAAYRLNPTSLTHSNFDQRRLGLAKANFEIIKNVQSVLPEEYNDIKKELDRTDWMWFQLANAYKHVHKYFQMSYALLRCFLSNPTYIYKRMTEEKRK
ncbi:MAG: hypothetical protein Q4D14_00610 [Bacteroidales bacterium]|nr:hypothetical protein [Bacteroidales bacterium]